MTADLHAKAWAGGAALRPGLGVFIGQSGDNQAHRHWAHQISVGLGPEVIVTVEGRPMQASAVFIAADTVHQLAAGRVLSIYVDPTTALSRQLLVVLGIERASGITVLPVELTDYLRQLFMSGSLEAGMQALLQRFMPVEAVSADPRLDAVLAALAMSLSAQTKISRQTLAAAVGLSESRFSHWFADKTGMPLRSYSKWLRLIQGLEQMLSGHSLTTAAHQAEFSDLAHFSRSFVQIFGVRPSALLAQVSLVRD